MNTSDTTYFGRSCDNDNMVNVVCPDYIYTVTNYIYSVAFI